MNVHPVALEKHRLSEFPTKWLALGAVLIIGVGLVSLGLNRESGFAVGQKVLARCHDSYLLGQVQRIRKSGYSLKFGSDARPITCTPYLWKPAYLTAYQPAESYQYQGVMLHPGEQVTLTVQVEKRPYRLHAVIDDLTREGLVKLSPVDGDPLARGYFDQIVGTNYISLSRYPLRPGKS